MTTIKTWDENVCDDWCMCMWWLTECIDWLSMKNNNAHTMLEKLISSILLYCEGISFWHRWFMTFYCIWCRHILTYVMPDSTCMWWLTECVDWLSMKNNNAHTMIEKLISSILLYCEDIGDLWHFTVSGADIFWRMWCLTVHVCDDWLMCMWWLTVCVDWLSMKNNNAHTMIEELISNILLDCEGISFWHRWFMTFYCI